MTRKNEQRHGESLLLTIGALAAQAVVKINSATTMSRDGKVVTARVQGFWGGTAGDCAFLSYGIAASFLTNADIAAILLQTPDRPRDVEERVGYVRLIGNVMNPATVDTPALTSVDSGWVKLLVDFFDDETPYTVFILNHHTTAPATTGGTFRVFVESLISYPGAK